MKLINYGVSEKLHSLLIKWTEECRSNIEHDIDNNQAWNELISYLMYLENPS